MDGLRSLETLLVDELLLQQRAGAQNQVRGMMQDTSGSIAEQNEQQLAAGAQQMVRPKLEARMMKERQDQARQRQALAGIAGQSAPNMARMADGGIVGYAEGGPTPGAVPPKAADSQDIKRLADLYRQAQASMKAATDPTAKAAVQQRLNDLKAQMGDQLPFVMQYIDSTKGAIEPRTDMAEGGIVGFQSRGYVDALAAALEAEGITDPVAVELIRSIYGQESSSGRDTGPSPAGARGPMQVMPATFVEMMGPDADIDDPMTNLRAGARYAQQMLRRAGGDPRLAAAGYYGGPGGMDKLRAGEDTQAPQEDFPSVSEYADEVTTRMRTTPESVERLLDLDELSEEAQEVETEAPRERPMTPEERRATIDPERFDARMGRNIEEFAESAVDFVKENPLLAASMVVPGGLAARGLGSLGLAGIRRFGPGMLEGAKRVVAPLVSKPKMSGYGSTIRNPRTGRMMSAKDAQAAGLRLNRQASPMRMATTASGIGLLTEAAGRMAGGDGEVAAEEVAAAPAPREPTPQEKLGSMVGRPTAMFKAGEPAQGRERDIDIDRLISFLQGGADQQNIAGALAGGSRADIAYQQGERKRQDELKALDEMRKLEREKIGATIGAAEIRSQAATAQKRAETIMEYITKQPGIISRQSKIDAGMSPEEADRAVQREAEILADRVFGASSGLGSMQGLNVTPSMLAADEALGIN